MSTPSPSMSQRSHPADSSRAIAELLRSLRARIHQYAWRDGGGWLIVCLIGAFLAFVCVDYLPIRLGASELPPSIRLAVLTATGAGLLWVLYRGVLRRVWARIQDRSLALLVERSHPQLQDRLVTLVELPRDEGTLATSLREDTWRRLAPQLAEIDLGRVFNYRPLRKAWTFAGIATLFLLVCVVASPRIMFTAAMRLYGLSPRLYPRNTVLTLADFEGQEKVVARGSDFAPHVLADARLPARPPRTCVINYRTADGERGRVNMRKQGSPKDGIQHYTFDGKPFKGLIEDVVFDVRGGDANLRGFKVRVVDSPQITTIRIQAEFPEYMGLVPRDEPYRAGMAFPLGTRVHVRCQTNKPVRDAVLREPSLSAPTGTGALASEEPSTNASLPIVSAEVPSVTVRAEGETSVIEYELPHLERAARHEISLLDQHGIPSRRPQEIHLEIRVDEPPRVEAWLSGIGAAVTPDALLPFQGSIEDDFGVQECWIELGIADGPVERFPFTLDAEQHLDARVDLREARRRAESPLTIPLETRIHAQAKASDRFALGSGPQVGQGDRFDLEVVSPERLLALLEARELSLRRRFEQIVSEMRQTRDSLSRLTGIDRATSRTGSMGFVQTSPAGAEPEDSRRTNIPQGEVEEDASQASLRLLRVQRGGQEVRRGAQEVDGVALSFLDICQELDNNRIDSVERQKRLREGIADPLRTLAQGPMEELATLLAELESRLTTEGAAGDLPAQAVGQADEVIAAMEEILKRMLDLESYNELVDLVRGLIDEQEALIEKTKAKQRAKALELLKDDAE